MAGINLDLKKAHKHRNIGDLIIVYSWVNDCRAMILIPARRANSPWYIAMEHNAWQYDDPEYLARQAKIACEVLGMRPVPENWVKIASIIHEGLPDLIEMPPAPLPEHMSSSYGKLELRADGDVIGGEDLRLEKAGVLYA